jgi:hypothetical protein
MAKLHDPMVGAKSSTGIKTPKGATTADTGGEMKPVVKGGVAMGKTEADGNHKDLNTGRTNGICYEHKRSSYGQ